MDAHQRHEEEQFTREQLVRIGQGGEVAQVAVGKLYNHYARRFHHHVMYKFKCSVETSEDIVQETFVRLVRQIGQNFTVPDNPRAWLYTILHRCVIDHYRKQQKVADAESAPAGNPDDGDPEDNTPGHVATEYFWECALRAFRAFRRQHPEAADALELVILEGWTGKELAAYLGKNEGATREFLSQWRKRFRAFLQRFCQEHLEAPHNG